MEEERFLRVKSIIDVACNNIISGKSSLELIDALSISDEEIAKSILDDRTDFKYLITTDVIPQIFIKSNRNVNKDEFNKALISFYSDMENRNFKQAINQIDILMSRLKTKNFDIIQYNKIANVYRYLGNEEEAYKYTLLCCELFKRLMEKNNMADLYHLINHELIALESEDAYLGIINYDKDFDEKFIKRIAILRDFKYFLIKNNNETIIIIELYKRGENKDFPSLKNKLDYCIYTKSYQEYIDNMSYFIRYNRFNRGKYYYFLAVAYKELGKIDLAIRMLMASKLFNYQNGNIKYLSLIDETIKEYEEYNREENGLSDIDCSPLELDLVINDRLLNIAHLINFNSSLISNFDLSSEEEIIVYLILARECFINGEVAKGDKFIRLAEKVKNKTKRSINLIKEVQMNKKLYSHQKDKYLSLK